MSLKFESIGVAATAVGIAVGALLSQPIVLLVAAGAAIFLSARRITDPERVALRRLKTPTATPPITAAPKSREAATVSR